MPRLIGKRYTGTANSSVTNSPARGGDVDLKFNSNAWTLNEVYSKRKNVLWPIVRSRNTGDIDFEIWGAGGGSAEQPGLPGRRAGGGGGGYMSGTIPGESHSGEVIIVVGSQGVRNPSIGTYSPRGAFGGPGRGWSVSEGHGASGGGFSGIFDGQYAHANAIVVVGGGGGAVGYDNADGGVGGGGGGPDRARGGEESNIEYPLTAANTTSGGTARPNPNAGVNGSALVGGDAHGVPGRGGGGAGGGEPARRRWFLCN